MSLTATETKCVWVLYVFLSNLYTLELKPAQFQPIATNTDDIYDAILGMAFRKLASLILPL